MIALLNAFKNRSSTLNQTILKNFIVFDNKILFKIYFTTFSSKISFKKFLLIINKNLYFVNRFFWLIETTNIFFLKLKNYTSNKIEATVSEKISDLIKCLICLFEIICLKWQIQFLKSRIWEQLFLLKKWKYLFL